MAPLMTVEGLRVEASSASGRIVAVDELDLEIAPGEAVGIIGESGSGKTTTVRSLIDLLERNVEITAGSITFQGEKHYGPGVNRLHRIRGRHVGMIFQSALNSLNPLLRVGTQLREVLKVHRPDLSDDEKQSRMQEVLRRMEFPDPDRVLKAYPHQLSGGMRQRAAIALAIVTEPELVIADECTSALDVTTQAEVMELLRGLAEDRGTALLFVTHDLLLAAEVCDRIVVMYGGAVVETGVVEQVLREPRHPYTQALLRSVPTWGPPRPLAGIEGTPPKVTPGTVGCRFAARCAYTVDACRERDVPLFAPGDGHDVRCLLPDGVPVPDSLRDRMVSPHA